MARRMDRIFNNRSSEARSNPAGLSWNDYLMMAFNGHKYTLPGATSENVESTFNNYVKLIGRSHGIVGAAVAARAYPMSQIRFAWKDTGRGSDSFGQLVDGPGLDVLERPSEQTRPELLVLAEMHRSYAGTSYFTRRNGFRLLRPDLVDAVIVGPDDAAAVKEGEGSVVGYLHYANGRDKTPTTLGLNEVAACSPEPDPICWWRGQSWVTGVLREVALDRQATEFVDKFLANSATPNMIIKPDSRLSIDQVKEFRAEYDRVSAGASNAGRTLWLGGGSDVTVVGSKIGELAVRELQGGSETRIAVRSRVPAPVLGIREGMQGSALNASSYGQTRRLWADQWFSPTADMLTATLEKLFPPPANRTLTFDPDQILLLQEDRKDAADILVAKAGAIRQLVDAGFTPTSAEKAVRTGNTAVLVHSGLMSVQLLPPGSQEGTPDVVDS